MTTDSISLNWFNLSAPGIVWRCRLIKPWNAFHHVYDREWARRAEEPARQWGFGLLQVGRRHLLYVGHAYAYVGFVRVWGSR